MLLKNLMTPILVATTVSCTTTRHIRSDRPECVTSVDSNATQQLNAISRLFKGKCYEEVIAYAEIIRNRWTHKTYSFTAEVLEFFIADGTLTDYVLESYERGFLGILVTLSHFRLGQRASPSLHRTYNNLKALAYNHGTDHVSVLLQATLWDNLKDPNFSGDPFWRWLIQNDQTPTELRSFAQKQMASPSRQWLVYGIDHFPKLDWKLAVLGAQHGTFEVTTKPTFKAPCASTASIFVPTLPWFRKIAARHARDYHPLVNAKTWIRLPIGIVYGAGTAVAGVGIAAAGCSMGSIGGGSSGGDLCQASAMLGLHVLSSADDLTLATLRPDLRHWEDVPAGIEIVSASQPEASCLDASQRRTFDFSILTTPAT